MTILLRGFQMPVSWQANGVTNLFDVAPTPGTFNVAGVGPFDGGRLVLVAGLRISSITLHQRVAGASGSTTVEVYRYRSAAFTQITTTAPVTVAFGAGNMGTVTTTPSTAALRVGAAGDVYMVQATAVQGVGAVDFWVTMQFGSN